MATSQANPIPPARVLIIEDEEQDRLAIRRCLDETKGLMLEEAATLDLARQAMDREQPDLILLDLNIAGQSGMDLLHEIDGIPVIIMSGQGSEALAAEAIREGASDYVIKDLGGLYCTTLARRIESALGKKRAELEKDRLLAELQEALVSIKTLSGLIPICSGCKKIRNDAGFWQRLESYLHEHSGATLSHGMCPDCFADFEVEVEAFHRSQEITASKNAG